MRALLLESKLRLAAWLLSAGLLMPSFADAAPPEHESATESEPEDEEQRKQAAREQVRAGSTAFGAGDYQTAIDHYEAAMALLPGRVLGARGRDDARAFFASLNALVARHVGVPLACVGELERDDLAAGLSGAFTEASPGDTEAAFLRGLVNFRNTGDKKRLHRLK